MGLREDLAYLVGAKSATSARAVNARKATMAKLQRQPTACPHQFASGTPMMVATVRPRKTCPTACVRLFAGTNDEATIEAMPK